MSNTNKGAGSAAAESSVGDGGVSQILEVTDSVLQFFSITTLTKKLYFVYFFIPMLLYYIVFGWFATPHSISGQNKYSFEERNRGFCVIRFDYPEHGAPKPIMMYLTDDMQESELDEYFHDSQYFYDYSEYYGDSSYGNKLKVENDRMSSRYAYYADMLYFYNFLMMWVFIPFDAFVNVIAVYLDYFEEIFGKSDKPDLGSDEVDNSGLFMFAILWILFSVNAVRFLYLRTIKVWELGQNLITGILTVVAGYLLASNNIFFHVVRYIIMLQYAIVTGASLDGIEIGKIDDGRSGTFISNMEDGVSGMMRGVLTNLNEFVYFFLHYDTMYGMMTLFVIIRVILIFFVAIYLMILFDINVQYLVLIFFLYIFSPILPILIMLYAVVPVGLGQVVKLYFNTSLVISLRILIIGSVSKVVALSLHGVLPLAICYHSGLHGFDSWYVYDNVFFSYKQLYFVIMLFCFVWVMTRYADYISQVLNYIFEGYNIDANTGLFDGISYKNESEDTRKQTVGVDKNQGDQTLALGRDKVGQTLGVEKNQEGQTLGVSRDQNSKVSDGSGQDGGVDKKNSSDQGKSSIKRSDSTSSNDIKSKIDKLSKAIEPGSNKGNDIKR